jgi:hypothetical protein
MSDLSQDSLLREIDEDIRHEKYAKLWKQYGKFVIAAAVALVVGVAGFKFWQYRTQAEREQAGQQFSAAMALASTDASAAEQALHTLAESGPRGYGMLAGFQQADLLLKNGDRQAARAVYQALQQSTDDVVYRDLAVVLEALAALEKEALPIDADALRSKLQSLRADSNPWRFTARELIALLAWRTGQTTEARSELTALAEDPLAPPDMRNRAQQLLTQVSDS